jgi:monoamine oxidase
LIPRFAAKTPLFQLLQRSFHLAALSLRTDVPPVDELVEMSQTFRLNRRGFLKGSLYGAVALGVQGLGNTRVLGATALDTRTKIVVVGAGISGLNCAHTLKKAGLGCAVYEATFRPGGRIVTGRNMGGHGIFVELGGEFIDSDHTEMLGLARELALPLMDTQTTGRRADRYFFDQRQITEAELIPALRPLVARIQHDLASLSKPIDYLHNSGATALDAMSIADYLNAAGATGWLRRVIEVAYTQENGLEPGAQSALNMLAMLPGDPAQVPFDLLGGSDERFKIRGGNQQLTEALGKRLEGSINFGHHLEAVQQRGTGYRLTFQDPRGAAKDVDADVLVLCMPFTVLRQVALHVEMPPVKAKAIKELGYGKNAKLILGFKQRSWNAQPYGYGYAENGMQMAWESSHMYDGPAGAITVFKGGDGGLALGQGTELEQATHNLPLLEPLFPGATAAFNGKAVRFNWPTYPLTQGSYASYLPGQWTSIAGAEGTPIGNMYFAGEHTSKDWQGFMNGAAQTGRLAAQAIIAKVAGKPQSGAAPATR